MNAIVAVDQNWGIGKDNNLLFYIPDDLQYFKQKTLAKTIVMGRNTLLSFPRSKPLPNRRNIVLSSVISNYDCEVYDNMDKLINVLKTIDENDIFIVGGAMFYKSMLKYCKTAYVTKVEMTKEADCFFPNLDILDNWTLSDISDLQTSNGINFRYTVYHNNNPEQL